MSDSKQIVYWVTREAPERGGYAHISVRVLWGQWLDAMDDIRARLSRPDEVARLTAHASIIKDASADNSTRYFDTSYDNNIDAQWQSNRVQSDDYAAKDHPELVGTWVNYYGLHLDHFSPHILAIRLLDKLARYCDKQNIPRPECMTPAEFVAALTALGARPVKTIEDNYWHAFVSCAAPTADELSAPVVDKPAEYSIA